MDDVIPVWNYCENELKGFLQHLYSYDRNLRFTLETETDGKIPSLDVVIIRIVNKLDFKVYRKPKHNNKYSKIIIYYYNNLPYSNMEVKSIK